MLHMWYRKQYHHNPEDRKSKKVWCKNIDRIGICKYADRKWVMRRENTKKLVKINFKNWMSVVFRAFWEDLLSLELIYIKWSFRAVDVVSETISPQPEKTKSFLQKNSKKLIFLCANLCLFPDIRRVHDLRVFSCGLLPKALQQQSTQLLPRKWLYLWLLLLRTCFFLS